MYRQRPIDPSWAEFLFIEIFGMEIFGAKCLVWGQLKNQKRLSLRDVPPVFFRAGSLQKCHHAKQRGPNKRREPQFGAPNLITKTGLLQQEFPLLTSNIAGQIIATSHDLTPKCS